MFWRRRKDSTQLPVSSGGFSLGTDESSSTTGPSFDSRVANSDSGSVAAPPAFTPLARMEVPKVRGTGFGQRQAVSSVNHSGSSRPSYILPEDYRITGSVFVKGEIRLDGELSGRGLVAGRVVVTPKGLLQAPTDAREVVVQGQVSAPLKVKELLEIQARGEVRGQIEAGALKVDEGAVLTDAICVVGLAA